MTCDRTRCEAAPNRGVILLVEDDDGVRSLTARFLHMQGLTVLEADDAETAMAISDRENGRIDLLITDLLMPRMGGEELAEWMRAHRPGIRVIFISGYSPDEIRDRFVGRCPGEVLPKPFTLASFSAVVHKSLRDG